VVALRSEKLLTLLTTQAQLGEAGQRRLASKTGRIPELLTIPETLSSNDHRVDNGQEPPHVALSNTAILFTIPADYLLIRTR